ncbi:hypothetical protein EV175_001788, partial [Coemansia sp. RSA 1933]
KVKWALDTRYYSVELEFWIDTTEQLSESERQYMQSWLEDPDRHNDVDAQPNTTHSVIPVDGSMVQLQDHLRDVVDAVVFMFDPADPSSFADILPWARYGLLNEPGVLLCLAASAGPIGEIQKSVSSKSVGTVGSEDDKDKWVAWCISNGWEWVDLTDPDPDTDNTVERVREALVSNEWADMMVKQPLRRTTAADPPTPSAQVDPNEPEQPQPDSSDNGSTSSNVGTRPIGEKEQEEWDLFESISQSVDPGRVEALRSMLLAYSASEQIQPGDDRLEAVDDSTDIAPLLDRLRRMREEISHLDKDQARAKAAELAMAFAKNV